MKFKSLLLVSMLVLGFSASAAKVGGTIYLSLSSEPTTLHPITAEDAYAAEIHGLTFSQLGDRNLDNYEQEPALAEKWEISKDGMTFTFFLRPGITFHDGKPITADDVKFSFDAIFDPQFKAFHKKPYYENIDKAEVINPTTIKFTAKKKYFNNFDVLSEITVMPKHVYSKFDKKQNRTIVGSGPYKFVSFERGKSIILERYDKWFGWNVDFFKNQHNFSKVFYRFIQEENLVLESLKRGDLDFDGLTPEQYEVKTVDKAFTDKLTKVKTENQGPGSYGFIGWNMKNEFFKERDVRVALAHLMNREQMIKKFLYNNSVPAAGPWHFQSPYASKSVKPWDFDPKKAGELLKKAGWTDSDKDGVLDKSINGKLTPFRFSLIYVGRDTEKYFTIYKEDMKKAGIDLVLKQMEWNSFIKLVNEQKFEACALAWGGGSVDIDPKQIWHSESDRVNGHNFVGYRNADVDKLIDQARGEMDRSKRIKILQEAYEKIANDAPYLFLFNRKFQLYAHNKRISKAKDTYKFGVGRNFWWMEKP